LKELSLRESSFKTLLFHKSFSIAIAMNNTAEYVCAYCGEANLTFVDFSAGGQQSYVEDCQVCCRPNVLYVRIDEDTLDVEIDSEYEG
jgi:hypothetical protein